MVDVGVYKVSELHDRGLTRTQVQRLVRDGRLVRVRNGWYARPDAHWQAREAVGAHGALTCISALRLHGIWTMRSDLTHTRLARNADRSVRRKVRVCTPFRDAGVLGGAVDDVLTALAAAVRCQRLEHVLASVDSALFQKKVSEAEVRAWIKEQPVETQGVLRRYSLRAASGTEALARVRLLARGIAVQVNPRIPGVGWVDLLVGDLLVIECDSRAYHDDLRTFTQDRRRDQELVRQGYVVVRLTCEDVVFEWDRVEPVILEIIRAGRHRRPRRRG